MNHKQKRTLVLAGIISTLFACYKSDEKTKLHKQLQSRINKGARKMARQYGGKAVDQVIGTEADILWKDAVDHFTKQKITIEAGSCVLALWNEEEKMLTKHYGLSASKVGKWAKPSNRSDADELDKASRVVAKYIFASVSAFYGIELEKKLSVLERIALARDSA